MKYMLDTNICIYLIKQKPREVLEKMKQIDRDDVCISSITYSELSYGIEKSAAVERNRIALLLLLANLKILNFDDYAALEYGKVRTELEKHGKPIGALDMLIAAHAKAYDLTLVTNNTGEFSRVSGLKLDNWVNR